MSNKVKIFLCVLAGLVLGFVLGVVGVNQIRNGIFGASRGQVMYSDLSIGGDLYEGRPESLLATGGNIVGNIVQTAASAVNTMLGTNVMGTVIANNLIFANGAPVTYTTTSTITTAQFCSNQLFLIQNTTSSITITAPTIAQVNAATSTCASAVPGGAQVNLWINDSSNTVTFAPVTGYTFEYANISATSTNGSLLLQSVGTTTFTLASGTTPTSISFYGIRETSSTFKVLVTGYR